MVTQIGATRHDVDQFGCSIADQSGSPVTVSLNAFDSGYQLCYSRAGCMIHSFATGHTLRGAMVGPSISGMVEPQTQLPA